MNLLNLFLIYVGSVFIILGMLKFSNHNETFKKLSCIHDNNNYQILVGICLVPLFNSFMCIIVTMSLLLNVLFSSCKLFIHEEENYYA